MENDTPEGRGLEIELSDVSKAAMIAFMDARRGLMGVSDARRIIEAEKTGHTSDVFDRAIVHLIKAVEVRQAQLQSPQDAPGEFVHLSLEQALEKARQER